MEKKTNIRAVTAKELLELFLHNFWIMILVSAIVVGGVFAVITLTYTPKYESIAKLYILRQEQSGGYAGNASSDDFSLALAVVKDCDNLIKGHSVLDDVIDELQLDMTYDDLYDSIHVSNPEDTRILTVRAESDSPERAKMIVDKICEIGTQEIEEAMGFKQVNFYEPGIIDFEPSNKTTILFYALLGIITATLTYLVFLVIFLSDDRIQTIEEFEQTFGITSLGEIPNMDGKAKKKRYGYYKGRYSNRYGSKYGYKYYGNNSKDGGNK